MNALRELWQNNPYAVAAAVVAPIVFGVVFAAVWLLAGGGGDDGAAVAQVEQAERPAVTVVQVQSEPDEPQSAAPAQQGADAAGEQSAGSAEEPAVSAAQGRGSSDEQQAEPSAAEPEPEPLPTLPDVLGEEIDESSFRYGLEEERGAILPIANGIVPSSGPNHQTSWELLLPTARIRAEIVSVGRTPSGLIGATDNPFVVGWFNLSVAPGEVGNSILGGHRDYEDVDGNIGAGVCWELDRVEIGDLMVIRDTERNLAWVYEVTDSAVVDPRDRDSLRYLRESDEPIITLITCMGSFDPNTHLYSHRLVVVAKLQATAST